MSALKCSAWCVMLAAVVVVGCAENGRSGTSYRHKSGMGFEFPDGWSRLSRSEFRDRGMGKDNTLITVMDDERDAGFSVIPVSLPRGAATTSRMPGDEVPARAAMLLESMDRAGPGKYRDYKLIGRGATMFAGVPMGEITYRGRNPGKELRWYRVLIGATSDDHDFVLMLVFTTPVGESEAHRAAFAAIENSWQWNG